MGKELQSLGCDVYLLITARDLEVFHLSFFKELAADAGSKTVVLLVNEVHSNLDPFVERR